MPESRIKSRIRRLVSAAAAFCLLLSLSGCAITGTEDLYALPQMSDASSQLEQLISERIEAGSEYAAPTEGSRRQSVQMQDVTGDGTAEAVAFLADENHTPTVCIYSRDGQQNYYLYVIIRGEGSSVCQADYADLTGDGIRELILTWQVSEDIRLLTVYTMAGGEPQQLLSADCRAFAVTDLTGDGKLDLINLRADGAGTIDCCSFAADGGCIACSTALSAGIEEVCRMRTGMLADGVQALFVESLLSDGSLITDVLAAPGGAVSNITMTAEGYSETIRPSPAYAEDVNNDGVLELPRASGDILEWYDLDSSGSETQVMTTYHSYDDGWYLVLDGLFSSVPEVETGSVVAGSDYTIFYNTAADGTRTELLAIYTLTGENRSDRAALEGRFVLADTGTVIYAAVLKADGVTQDSIINNFSLIYMDRQTGEL